MWELYNALLAGLPRSGCVTRTVPGRRWTLAETERWLSPNLGYDPEE